MPKSPLYLPLSRRGLLGAGAVGAAGLALGWPRRARAEVSRADLKFIFVCNHGGWDSTRVFEDAFDNPAVGMEGDAARATAGSITYVDHPARPSVREFFEAHYAQALIVKGVAVRSISHDVCSMMAMTGSASGAEPDWGAILAAERRSDFVAPHLIAGGFSFPGELGVSVTRTGSTGQLDALLSGRILNWSDEKPGGPTLSEEALIDSFVSRRVDAAAAAARGDLAVERMADLAWANHKVELLKEIRWDLDLRGGRDIDEQAAAAVAALGMGLTRCATLGYPEPGPTLAWDTHQDNDPLQSDLFEGLFAGLNRLMRRLESWPGQIAATLAEETVVVVLSEMDRTPLHNNFAGKDHWPYTDFLIVGPNVTGDRVVGGLDPGTWGGQTVDLSSGELSASGEILNAEILGATLLALGDVDPGPWLPGEPVLEGVLL